MTTIGVVASSASSGPVRVDTTTRGWQLHRKVWSAAISGLFVLALWAFFAPPVLGGRTSYTMVSGTSMLPHFHTGDLLLLREEPSYHVGEVAGYHNGQLHAVVMHRIVAIKDGHYYFKGDNNSFVDPYHPTESQIVGADWIALPGAGRYLQDLRVPAVGAVLAAVLWVLSFRSRPASRRRRRRHHHAQ